MSYDAQVIAALVALIGIFITAALSSAGYFFRMRSERRKSTRKALYLLLEIRHSIITKLFDPEVATREYVRHSSERLRAHGIEVTELPPVYLELIKSHFHNVVASLRTDVRSRLLDPFEEALLDMATIAPVLAYRLRGKENLEQLIGHTQQYRDQVSSSIEAEMPETIREIMQDSLSQLTKETLQEAVELLDHDVLLLAKASGWRDRLACRRVIRTNVAHEHRIDFDELDKTIDRVLRNVMAGARAARVATAPSSPSTSATATASPTTPPADAYQETHGAPHPGSRDTV